MDKPTAVALSTARRLLEHAGAKPTRVVMTKAVYAKLARELDVAPLHTIRRYEGLAVYIVDPIPGDDGWSDPLVG